MDFATPRGTLKILDPRARLPNELEGFAIIIDKPLFWSSFDVIRFLKWTTKIRKIGHAGTLDPLATGVLVCLIGRAATRHADFLTAEDKGYVAKIELGTSTDSYDAEGEVVSTQSYENVTQTLVRKAILDLKGDYLQEPPMFSARKVGGERLYKKARRGESIKRGKSKVEIHSSTVLDVSIPSVSFELDCSKGTYIRSIAHDLGRDLGCGAFLSALRRTRSGSFNLDHAWSIDRLAVALGVSLQDFHKPKRLRDLDPVQLH